MQPTENYCVLDIETWTPTGKPDPDKDELRYVGFKAPNGKKVCYHYTESDKIQKALDYFTHFVGHNIILYDIPVLKRHGYEFNYKVIIDTYRIAEQRCKQMMYIDLNQGQKGLKTLCERFGLEHQKGEFDYALLQADRLEDDNYDKLVEYLYGDLDACDDLFKYFYSFFYGFREYVSDKDKARLSWLTCSSGATAYKCICNMAGLKEEYEERVERDEVGYEGGFVSDPYLDYAE